MIRSVLASFKPAAVFLGMFTVLTGVVYPLLVTAAARAFWPDLAEGSLVRRGDRVVGSRLVGQPFQGPQYFWGRPSALAQTSPVACSGGSNLGMTNPERFRRAAAVAARFRQAAGSAAGPVPVDLVTASGSGLDPHISLAAARYQLPRVARARGVPEGWLRLVVDRQTAPPQWGLWGESRVNVLELNLELDRLCAGNPSRSGQ